MELPAGIAIDVKCREFDLALPLTTPTLLAANDPERAPFGTTKAAQQRLLTFLGPLIYM